MGRDLLVHRVGLDCSVKYRAPRSLAPSRGFSPRTSGWGGEEVISKAASAQQGARPPAVEGEERHQVTTASVTAGTSGDVWP